MKRLHTTLCGKMLSAMLVASGLASGLQAQNTLTWTGDASGNWQDAANWSGTGAPPGTNASDIAQFDAGSANTAITLGTDASIGQLQFLEGAAQYTFSGSALEIIRASGRFIEHNAGNHQTIESQVRLHATTTSANTRALYVGTGSSLTFVEGIVLSRSGTATDNNITLSGGGTVTMGKGFTALNSLTVMGSGTTLDFRGGGNRLIANDGGRINLLSQTSASLDLRSSNSSIYAQFAGSVANSNSLDVRSSAGNTVTFGADIAGGGTATYNRIVSLHRDGTVDNATIQFDAKAGNTLLLSGSIQDYNGNAAGAGTRVEITGDGVVRFGGTSANTSLTPIEIAENATLELAKSDGVTAIAGDSITVRQDGTLRLLASNQIADSVSLFLDGGNFNVGEYSDTLGALSVSAAGGSIDFSGTAGVIAFSSLLSIEGLLTINGWSENMSIVFADGSGWDMAALAQVNFVGFGAAQFDVDSGRLYAAIPEPGTTAAIAGAVALGLLCLKRRRR